MDIASTPEVAPPPVTIHREDYRPFAWRVPQTRLRFTLGLERTRVQANFDVERNPDADPSPVLRLSGDGLTPAGVWIDGALSNDWEMDGSDLLITFRASGTRSASKPRSSPPPTAS